MQIDEKLARFRHYLQLKKLDLSWLSSVNDFVEGTGGKGRYLPRINAFVALGRTNLTICITPRLAAARVKFSSPSGCPSFPSAVAV